MYLRAVNANLMAAGFSASGVEGYEVFDVHGLKAFKKKNRDKFTGFDLVFTIFGPLYLPRDVPNHIVGFAQAWIIYPNNEVNRLLSLKQALLLRLKFLTQCVVLSQGLHDWSLNYQDVKMAW